MTPGLTEKAAALAALAHAGHVDKAGKPYFGHVARVAASRRLAGSPVLIAAGYLHDAIEDTLFGRDELLRAGIPLEVVEIVERLTRRPGETYAAFIARIAKCPRARLVKLADLDDNTDPARGAALPATHLARYRAAYAALGEPKGI